MAEFIQGWNEITQDNKPDDVSDYVAWGELWSHRAGVCPRCGDVDIAYDGDPEYNANHVAYHGDCRSCGLQIREMSYDDFGDGEYEYDHTVYWAEGNTEDERAEMAKPFLR